MDPKRFPKVRGIESEIDFVAHLGAKRYLPIEVKYKW
jgi:hypothetical protein